MVKGTRLLRAGVSSLLFLVYTMEVIGDYMILSLLGSGGYGSVYKAQDRQTGELYAIKSVNLGIRPEVRYLIRKEIAAMRALKHPNIIALKQIFETPGQVHLAMELASGGDLRDFVNSNDVLPETLARSLFLPITKALRFAHNSGFVHRDLKLENILLDEFDNPKIADWGFASRWSPSTKLTDPVGSLFYCAPELLSVRQYSGPECDVWSLGVILYALVTSTLPFLPHPGERSDIEMRRRIATADYSIPSHVSSSCVSLLRSMLELSPQKRATLDEVLRHPWCVSCGEIMRHRPQLLNVQTLPKNLLRCSA